MFYRMVEDIDNLLGAVCAGVVQVFDILLPFLMGALIAYILLPLVRWVNKKLYARLIKRDGMRWAVSVGTIFLLVVAAVAGLFAYLVPVLVSNIQEFAANFSDYLEKGQDLITVCSACHHVIKRVNDDMANVEDIQTKVNNYMALSEPYLGETKVLHYLEVLRDVVGFDKIKEKVVNKKKL